MAAAARIIILFMVMDGYQVLVVNGLGIDAAAVGVDGDFGVARLAVGFAGFGDEFFVGLAVDCRADYLLEARGLGEFWAPDVDDFGEVVGV